MGPITGRTAGLLWKSYESISQFSFRNVCLVSLDWLRTKVSPASPHPPLPSQSRTLCPGVASGCSGVHILMFQVPLWAASRSVLPCGSECFRTMQCCVVAFPGSGSSP